MDFNYIKKWEINHASHHIYIHYLNGDKKILKAPGEQILFMKLWKTFVLFKNHEKIKQKENLNGNN